MSPSLPRQAVKGFFPEAFFTYGTVCLLIILYIMVFSWLSLQRYASLSINGLDLGYIDQVVWNILHGRFFYSSIRVSLPPASLAFPPAAYHFQPILAPLSLFYMIQNSPETLLVLQSIILGLGALPIFWLARNRLRSSLGGFVFALAYLLLPAMGWSSLTGFHSLSLAATALLFAFYFLQKRGYLGFTVFALLALASREDASLLVALMGLYALIVQKEVKAGIWTMVASLGWFLLTTLLIIPYYTYSSGPLVILRHYEFLDGTYQSALVFAAITVCVIYALGFLTVQLPQRIAISQRVISYALLGLILLTSSYYHYQAGASPLAKHYSRPESTAHQQLASELIEFIPSNVSISTQSSLLPHLSRRQKVYLFPAIKDAQYIFLDVTATPYPLEAGGVFQEATSFLNSGEFGVMIGRDGYILMKRGLQGPKLLPEEFYGFTKADASEVTYPYSADFGQMLRLVGYDYRMSYEPDTKNTISLTTYWQALRPPQKDYHLALFFRKDGNPNAEIDINSPTTLWYPTKTWTVGKLMKIETPPLPIEGFRYIDMAVVEANDYDGEESRLSPVESPEGGPLPIREEGGLQLLDLRKLSSSHPFSNSQLPPHPVTATPILPTPSPTPPPSTCPLCGLVVQEPGDLAFPPLAVKIDNSPGARPQSGLSEACIVYEHLTEWGITRFTAIYLCQPPDNIGPIRSARLIDLDLARQYKAVFAHVGASAPIMELLRISGLWDLDQFWYPYAYYRSNSRYAPYNVYGSTPRMQETIQAKGWQDPETPTQGFSFDSEPPPGGTPIGRVEIPFSNYSPVEYRYDEEQGSYLRWVAGQPHLNSDNEQISAANIIVQWVKSWETDILEDSMGGRSLQFELTGEGMAEIFRDGQVFYARWVRHNPDEITKFFDIEGRLLPLKPGNIWIAVVPIGMEIMKES